MKRVFIFFTFGSLLFTGSISFSKSLWWEICAKHWNECKFFYLKWYKTKLVLTQKEIQCVKNAKSSRDMNLCLWNVKRKRRKAFQQWRREFGIKYRQWLKEDKNSRRLNTDSTPQGQK